MKLFWQKRQHPKPVIPPELQPYYGQGSNGGWRRYILPVIVVVLAVLIGAVIWKIIDTTTNRSPQKSNDYIQAPQNNPSLKSDERKPAQIDSSKSTNSKPIDL